MTEDLKSQIVRLARDFSAQAHRSNLPGWDPAHAPFEPGVTTVPYAGRTFDSDEVAAAIASTLDFWLTLGPEGDGFEHELASVLGVNRPGRRGHHLRRRFSHYCRPDYPMRRGARFPR